MRAIVVGLLSLFVLCAPAAAQERGSIKNAYVLFSSDPLDIASDMTQYFSSRGVNARLFQASTFADQRRALGAPPNGGQGSGFFIDDNGTLVTNYHVVQDLPNLTVSTPAGMRPATILSTSSSLDVAVLSVRGYRPDRFIDLGPANAASVGQQVFAIGYPLTDALGASAKVTDGVVSSLSGLGDDASLMQISVPIQPGNSGGPIVLPTGLTSLEVTVEDFETGDLLSRFVWYGAGTKASVIRRAARKLDSDLGLSATAQ